MNLIGDLERLFASLYPLRIPITIAALLLVGALAVIAIRRGWHRVLFRHPRASLTGIALVLAVTLPITWVLASPLFIRTTLDEAAPVTGVADTSAATVLEGTFTGADEFHFGSGTARIIVADDGSATLRLEDFSVQNGPDLFVVLSPDPDGYADGGVNLGGLRATDGSFNHPIPAGTDLSVVRSVVIWCDAFSVLFATAPLTATA